MGGKKGKRGKKVTDCERIHHHCWLNETVHVQILHTSASTENGLNAFYLKGKKGRYQVPPVPLVLPALKGHRASLEYLAFLEAMLWGLQVPQDHPGHKDLQAHKAQQVQSLKWKWHKQTSELPKTGVRAIGNTHEMRDLFLDYSFFLHAG